MKVLMVCLGNICRSPMAEGVLRHLSKDRNVTLEIDSCGTNGFHNGEPADKRAIANLSEKGIDISDLRSRQIQKSDLDTFNQIFVMDKSNLENVLSMAESDAQRSKISLFLNESLPGQNLPVPDPYFGNDDGFEEVYQLINTASEAFLNKLDNE